jgi:hypothetical protein
MSIESMKGQLSYKTHAEKICYECYIDWSHEILSLEQTL